MSYIRNFKLIAFLALVIFSHCRVECKLLTWLVYSTLTQLNCTVFWLQCYQCWDAAIARKRMPLWECGFFTRVLSVGHVVRNAFPVTFPSSSFHCAKKCCHTGKQGPSLKYAKDSRTRDHSQRWSHTGRVGRYGALSFNSILLFPLWSRQKGHVVLRWHMPLVDLFSFPVIKFGKFLSPTDNTEWDRTETPSGR